MQGLWASSRRTSLCATITLQVRKDFLTRRSQCKESLSTTLHFLHINHAAEGDARRPKSHKSPTLTSPIPAESHARTAKCLTSPHLCESNMPIPAKGGIFAGCVRSHRAVLNEYMSNLSCKFPRASFLLQMCTCMQAFSCAFAHASVLLRVCSRRLFRANPLLTQFKPPAFQEPPFGFFKEFARANQCCPMIKMAAQQAPVGTSRTLVANTVLGIMGAAFELQDVTVLYFGRPVSAERSQSRTSMVL